MDISILSPRMAVDIGPYNYKSDYDESLVSMHCYASIIYSIGTSLVLMNLATSQVVGIESAASTVSAMVLKRHYRLMAASVWRPSSKLGGV